MGQSGNKKSFLARIKYIISLEDKNAWRLLLYPGIVFLFIITIAPTIYALVMSTLQYNLAKPGEIRFNFIFNYIKILVDRRFWNALGKTVTFTAVSLAIELVFGIALAMCLSKKIMLKSFIQICILIPMITTPVVVGLVWKMFYDVQFGMLAYFFNLLGLKPIDMLGDRSLSLLALIIIDIWEWTPYVTLIVLAGLQSLPAEPYEAAVVDGATPVGIFRWITLPLLGPVLSVAVLFRFMDLFKWMDTIYVVTGGGPGIASETLSFYAYITTFKFLEVGYGSALTILILIMIISVCNNVGKRLFLKGEN
jgi:multiple sugar transport system permease protein